MEHTKPKKRAFRACMPCRARKVRCIVMESCQPCMNCKLDEKDCDFAKGAKIYPKYPRSRIAGSKPPDTRSETSSHECPPTLNQAQSPVGSNASGIDTLDQRCSSNHVPNRFYHSSPTSSNPSCSKNSGLLYDPTEPSYSFLQVPKAKTILPQDLEFLYNQGCFIVPERHVLDEFMHKYFSFIHPILPILDEGDFWALYNSKTLPDKNYDRISILVLQGMLFTSSTFISEETFQSLGFKTTQDAKYTFYRRAKLLYDFGYERSSIAIAQAAVLLSHSHLIPLPYGGYKQLGSLWAGIAIHHARDARAHRYYLIPPSSLQSPEQIKHYNVLKRLWWCCVICDRVIPLTSRQNIKITKTNFNFDDSPILSVEDLSEEFGHSDVYDPSTKDLLAQALIKIVELCVVLTDVLSLSNSMHENPSLSLPQKFPEANPAGMCRVQLQRWYNSFLEWKCRTSRKTIQEASDKSPGSSVVLFTNLAEMYYHSARLTLCHYEMLHLSLTASSLNPNFDIMGMLQKSYELQNAIAQVTECITELTRLGLIRWLPMSAVGCTAFPLALQILDVELRQLKFSDLSQSKGSGHRQERLNVLIDAMKTYRPRYFIVDWVAQTIRHIVNVAQKCLPSTSPNTEGSGLSVASWIEILQMQPSCYLRLALTMDLSISSGKLPDETDFPPGLRHMLHGRITTSPESFPFNIDARTVTELPAINPSHATVSQAPSSEDSDGSPPHTEDSGAQRTPVAEDNLFKEGRVNNNMDELGPVFGNITNTPSMLSSIQMPGMDPSWGLINPGMLMGDSLGLISPFNFQPLNFDLESSQAGQDASIPVDTYQWMDGQSNNPEPSTREDDALFEVLRDSSITNLRSNDQRLLEELRKMMDMSSHGKD